jgi:molybdopterin-containing oxidoreductase family membrane subunit
MVAISEVKGVLPQADPHFYHGQGDGHGATDGPVTQPQVAYRTAAAERDAE